MNMQVGYWKKTSGFTIVELLIVVVVIAILASITIVSFNGIQNRAHDASVQNDLKLLSEQVQIYYAMNGSLPRGADFRNLEIKVAKGSYSASTPLFDNGSQYNLMYCSPPSPGDTYALVARSRSGTAYRYGTAGTGPITLSSSVISTQLCLEAGAPTNGTTDQDRQFLFQNNWQTWVND